MERRRNREKVYARNSKERRNYKMNQDKERLTINLSKKVVEILETISKKSLMSKEKVITFAILNFGKGIDDNNKNKK